MNSTKSLSKRIVAPVALTVALGFGSIACGSKGSSADSFCSTLKRLSSDKSMTLASMSTKDGQKKLKSAFGELESSAPADIKPSVQVISDALDKMSSVDLNNPADSAKLSKEIDQTKLKAASDKLDKYAKDTCHVQLDNSGSGSSGSGSGSSGN